MTGLATSVRNAVVLGAVSLLMFGAALVLTENWDDRRPQRQKHPDRVREVTLTVVLRPARTVSVRWQVAGRGDTVRVATAVWKHHDRARRGDLIVVNASQVIQGDYAHCAIYVDDQLEEFKKRDDGGSCVVTHTVS